MRTFFTALFLSLSLAACTAAAAPVSEAVKSRWAEPVRQDANLYRVDGRLYRSRQPAAADAATLHALGIKSVVNLRYFDRDDDLKHLGGRGFKLVSRPLLSWHITPRHIARVLYTIETEQRQGAVLVHCYHGSDRTGLIAGMYRIIYQGWDIEAAKSEMMQGPYGYHKVWTNIAALFSEEQVAEVKAHLAELRSAGR